MTNSTIRQIILLLLIETPTLRTLILLIFLLRNPGQNSIQINQHQITMRFHQMPSIIILTPFKPTSINFASHKLHLTPFQMPFILLHYNLFPTNTLILHLLDSLSNKRNSINTQEIIAFSTRKNTFLTVDIMTAATYYWIDWNFQAFVT